MVVLFVVDMINGFKDAQLVAQELGANLAGWITGPDSNIEEGMSYTVCPVQAGFEFTKQLFKQFDKIVFLTEHENYTVRIQQEELKHFVLPINPSNKKIESKMLFFGCSHTYGIGHATAETTYPFMLSSLLNREYINLGLPGKSNYDIEDLMNHYRFDKNHVVVQFTDMYRVRYFNSNKTISSPVYKLPSNMSKSEWATEENLFYNFQSLTERIINRLIESKTKFLVSYTSHYGNEYDYKCLTHLLQYREFCSHIGTAVDTADDGQHYGPVSHELWAKKLYNKWIELYGQS